MKSEMSTSAIKIGFWASMLSALMFIIFTVSFAGIALSGPTAEWTTLEAYVADSEAQSQVLKELAQLSMLAFGPLFVVLLNSIHEYASYEQKILTRISLCFAIAFAALIGILYFLQLSTVRIAIQNEQLEGIEQFMQFYPNSAVLAVGMLGWTLFLGLSSLFVAPVFSGSRLEKVIRIAFTANGVFCLLGGIGFVLGAEWLIFLTINLGMGAAVLVATIGLSIYFRRVARARPDLDALETPANQSP